MYRHYGKFSIAVGLLILLSLTAPFALGQTLTTGEMTGTITDATGGVIPGAKVTLKSIETGDTRTVETNSVGVYRASLLKPGNYQMSVAAAGLTAEISRIPVGLGQVQSVDVVMKPQQNKEIVTVTEAAPLLQTENAQLASSYSPKQVELLPTPGGDITSIAFTAPGVVVSTGAGYGNFSSHGLPATSNLYTTNGNDNMDPYLNLNNSGASNLTLGSNEVQEASVIQNAYGAQYGRQAGAQVNFITKSGANQFHGTALYNYNGSVMNANDFFANASGTPRGRANSNQWAGSIGGPIKKDKVFFFADTEGLRYVLPTTGVVSIPSQALQNYMLSNVSSSQVPLYKKAFALYNGATGVNRAVPVVNGGALLQDSYDTMGCGYLAGVATGVGTGVFGSDVSCANAFVTNVSNMNKEWLLSSRVDVNLTDNQKLYFRFKTDHGLQPTYTDPINSAFNAESNQPAYEGQVNHTWVITPRLVNSFAGSSSWYSAIFGPADLQASLSAFPQYWALYDGGPNGSYMTSLGLPLASYPQGRRVGQLQLVDDVSYTIGKHNIKGGLNYRYNRITDTGNQRLVKGGRFIVYDLNELAGGALDPSSGSNYQQRYTPYETVHLRTGNLGIYIQDEYAPISELKITLGLRMDHTANIGCTDDCFARMVSPWDQVSKGASVPYNQTIQTGLSKAFYDIPTFAAQPRFGMVYNPKWSNNTVIRGGIGLFTDMFPGTLASSIFGNSPNVFTPSVRTGTIGTPDMSGSAAAISVATGSAFQKGFANGSTLAQLQAALAPVAFTPPAFTVLPDSIKYPKYLQWSFEVEQQITPRDVVTLGYVGNHGYDLFLRNAAVNGYYNSSYPNFGGLPATQPDPRFRIVTEITNNAVSNYDGLSFNYRHAFSRGFTGQFSYTWSHALDTISNGGVGQYFSYNDSFTYQFGPTDALNYSNADYDIRHVVSADFVWEMPFKFQNKIANGAFGGWSIGSKWYIRGGTPFSVYNSSLLGKVSNSIGGSALADVIGNPSFTCGRSAVDTPCFTASSFQTTSKQRDFGNMPRNSFRGPGYFNTDLSVKKSFNIFTERVKLVLGADAYNLFNHANFANPNSNVAGGGLGQITGTVTPPSSPYGSFQGSAVSGRVIVVNGKFTF